MTARPLSRDFAPLRATHLLNRFGFASALGIALLAPSAGLAQTEVRANWKLQEQFANSKLQKFVYSNSISANWIGETDKFWYSWRDAAGTRYVLVDAKAKQKKPLFDHQKLAADLTEATKKPKEAHALSLSATSVTDDGTKFRFTTDEQRFELELATGALKSLGRAQAPPTQGQAQRPGTQQSREYRNFSPNRKWYAYSENHNLFVVEVGKEDEPIQLSKDGAQYYSFGSDGGFGGRQEDEEQQEERTGQAPRRVRANVRWSSDSKAFFVVRSDSRKVKELFLVNVLSQPRPTLMSYKYAMPGEADVTQQEVHVFRTEGKLFQKVPVERWKDQRVSDIEWAPDSKRLRFVRRDRLQRNLDLCEWDLLTTASKVLLSESTENAFLETQGVRYVKPGGDFIWFSERTGWGHYYLYSNDGTLKHALTSGPWRADSIVAVDAEGGKVWIRGVGRELGENPYHSHLYSVQLDGKNLRLLDPGDANHSTAPSPKQRFLVDSFSRIDLAPGCVLRDANGEVIMELEKADLSQLTEMGWRFPEPFVVKAADGVTEIYGNMWKPFDFNPNKKYPIIAYVYPGPQTESVTVGFSPTGGQQELAQLGFIVIQIGNRGGNPRRSNAYHSYGYYNLRDYGLADKKAGIEQLAAKNPWIDIERVGIYGHSGGGFMTAAALLVPPYNDFFKVGVSSAGNHDNNIYNQNWSEQHHGLKEVKKKVKDAQGNEVEETTFEIKVPTNAEMAANLKGKLLLVHGDMDNNVHPGNTIRLVDALIKANKRFDFMLMPGQAHGFGSMTGYFTQMMYEYFAEHLLGDGYRRSADMTNKGGN